MYLNVKLGLFVNVPEINQSENWKQLKHEIVCLSVGRYVSVSEYMPVCLFTCLFLPNKKNQIDINADIYIITDR